MMLKGATSPATLGRVLYGLDCSNVNIHDSLVTGGGASDSGYVPYGGLWFQDCDNVTIENNEFTANGPTIGFPKQGVADLGTNPFVIRAGVSHGFKILKNHVHGSHADISFAFNNLGDSEAVDNTIDENNTVNHHIFPNPTSGGYGIMFYGAGGVAVKSLTRRSGIVTAVTSPNHEAVGDHVRVTSTRSVGGTLFDGDFIILTRPDSTHLTWAQTAPDDTAADAGSVNISPQHVVVSDNTVRNTAGSSIYLQSVTDSTVDMNTVSNSSQQENPFSLCVGGISLTAPVRVTVIGNIIGGNTQDGICVSLGVDTTISGNTINAGKNGINMRGYFNSGKITNNKVQGGGVGINVPVGSLLYNSSITENTVSRQTVQGMYFGAAQKSTLGHNIFVPGPTTSYGLNIDSQKFASADNTIKNNVINGLLPGGAKGFHAAGVKLAGTNHVVEGNTLSNMASDALEDAGTGSTYSQNSGTGNAKHGLVLNSINCVASNNSVTGASGNQISSNTCGASATHASPAAAKPK